MSSLLALLDPDFRPYVDWIISVADYYHQPIRVASTRRTYAEQVQLYNDWLNGRNKYPVAYPGTSQHEQGLAADLNASPEVLAWLGGIWNDIGGTWGPSDPVHFGA